jgi:hypothetical protein
MTAPVANWRIGLILGKGGNITAPLVKLCISHIFFNNLESLVTQGFQD